MLVTSARHAASCAASGFLFSRRVFHVRHEQQRLLRRGILDDGILHLSDWRR